MSPADSSASVNGRTVDLDALREWLNEAVGMEIDFPDGITEQGRWLMDSIGVTVKEGHERAD